jgi:hypothetical protein
MYLNNILENNNVIQYLETKEINIEDFNNIINDVIYLNTEIIKNNLRYFVNSDITITHENISKFIENDICNVLDVLSEIVIDPEYSNNPLINTYLQLKHNIGGSVTNLPNAMKMAAADAYKGEKGPGILAHLDKLKQADVKNELGSLYAQGAKAQREIVQSKAGLGNYPSEPLSNSPVSHAIHKVGEIGHDAGKSLADAGFDSLGGALASNPILAGAGIAGVGALGAGYLLKKAKDAIFGKRDNK